MCVNLKIILPKDNPWYADKKAVKTLFVLEYEKNKEQIQKSEEIVLEYIADTVDLFAESIATTQLSAIKKFLLVGNNPPKVVIYANQKIIASFEMATTLKSNEDKILFNKHLEYKEV